MTTDLETNVPDVESMTDAQVDDLRGKMIAGEDVSAPVKEEAAPVVADDIDDDGGEDVSAPSAAAEGGKQQETVPHGRFHREMERRKEAESETKTTREQNRVLLERLEAVLKMVEPKPEAAPVATAPDARVDPLAALEYQTAELNRLKEEASNRTKRDEETAAETRVMAHAKEQFDRDVGADPAVRDAYTYLFETIAAEGRGYGLTGQDLNDHMTRAEKQHVFYALQNKRSLGEYAKTMATARGWKPAPANVNTTVDAAAAQAQINEHANIKNAAASLTPTGGSVARTGVPSPQELLDMTPKQFDDWRSKNELGKAFAA